ncbi:transcription-repair coupling factor [Aestuariirhabdus litorea]|uniref:Transcription-repair-coupling factor n=1 Tax=Aestuariirhabdus litorea TaxID=2528527 RepID=A0A3P3VSK0_9GAMM|nr:transcription-repair coupling factor [Aestuariirhabdus litorea]RRJ84666.1 transcription-repair coupling factor [Aestuariirhabdus litorea]RWW97890.1 transcription-repair coupling factor [Endozoicomonadaceae bacterium GTF-13]
MASLLPSPLPTPAKAPEKRYWGELHGAALGLTIATAIAQKPGLVLVVTPDSSSVERLEQQLGFFLKGSQEAEILPFPDWETLPYDHFSPHQDIISQRLLTLYQLPRVTTGVMIVSVTTLMHRLPPVDYLVGNSLVLSEGERLDLEARRRELEYAGYRCVDTVYEHGEFAIRGSILDIFPMGSQCPYRIDLFDDEIDSLRTFDPETQRSIDRVDSIKLLPAKEFPLSRSAIRQFKDAWHEHFDVDHRDCSLFMDVNQGISPAGVEYYLPLFFEQCATLFDYLPKETLFVGLEGVDAQLHQFLSEVAERYESRRYDRQRPLLPPHKVFLTEEEYHRHTKQYLRIMSTQGPSESRAGAHDFGFFPPPDLTADPHQEAPLQRLQAFLQETPARVLFCSESAGRREQLLELLNRAAIKPAPSDSFQAFCASDQRFGMTVAPIEGGFFHAQTGILLLTEGELFGQRVMQRRRRDKQQQDQSDLMVRNLTELQIGAPVVHLDHGVGRYQGLQTIEIDGQAAEFLTLLYANEAKLYVPVSSLHLISRYSGAEEGLAPLHKLGSDHWGKAKRKAAEKARDAAAELLDIYARRAAREGFRFAPPDTSYRMFAADFPFEETPDQQSAIAAVIEDMASKKPMDRLVCGDVGFGKTEVAMRAAFLAVQSNRQVAILVPTTLLAQQHYESFRDRFADWPVNVEVMSRFKSAKQVAEIQQKISEGKVDILIGTHKLLQGDVHFKQLGLLIIDEEHRFGVRQKERLKALRAEIDILTLTATPIPRTLNMAMASLRDLSIIATPPARRLSVNTFVRQQDSSLVKEAILRELLRGGQVYYLHNEVKSIERVTRELSELVPEARIGIGHGQMRERELEQVMSDFYHKRFNVLVCTTIIETGIDVPSANTIIIDRADKFGLAQLHQLRGRVGRSHHQAYAYLLTPSPKALTKDAQKRLEAISLASDLGAGFTLATHDLEIRGAGELLGDDQSGQIETVGFTLYMEMLDRAITSIRNGETPDTNLEPEQGPEINLRVPALIPDDYVTDIHSRLILYKRIASATDSDALRELQVEMIDRFGLLPDPAKYLFRLTELKLKAGVWGIRKIEASASAGRIEFTSQPRVDPLTIVKLVQSQPQKYRLEGATVLKYNLDMDGYEQRFQQTEQLLGLLTA